MQESVVITFEDPGDSCIENDQAVTCFSQDRFDVSHHHHCSRVDIDRFDERLGAGHVEVIGRFVEQQQIRRTSQYPAQQGSRLLAPRQHFDLLQGQVATEHHRSTDISHLGSGQHGVGAVDFFLDGALVLQHSHGALSEQAMNRRWMGANLSSDRFEFPCE